MMDMRDDSTEARKATQLLEPAQQAADRGDPIKMFRALAESGYLDGLSRRLQSKWQGSLPPHEVDECIAQAVDAAVDQVSQRRTISNLGAWLWKVAQNKAKDIWRLHYAVREDREDLSELDNVDTAEDLADRIEREATEEASKREAIRIARGLLPRIGAGKVFDAMEILIDAVEQGLPDLPPAEVAEALGIEPNAARALISRGLERLHRLTKEEGIEMLTGLPDTETEGEE